MSLQFPHCDPRILHGKQDNCKYCNERSEWQKLREVWGIAFTGHSYQPDGSPATNDEGWPLLPCPAESARGMKSVNSWHGNIAMTPEVEKAQDDFFTGLKKKVTAMLGYDPEELNRAVGSEPTYGKRVTLSGQSPDPNYDGPAPQPIDARTGQHGDYWVLSPEERAKGFVRPVRKSYKHVGVRPKFPTSPLTPEQQQRYASCNYVAFEEYPQGYKEGCTGCYWTREDLNSGCGSITSMADAIAESYARDPKFYSSTFCSHCGNHFPVGENGEFVWVDGGSKVGS